VRLDKEFVLAFGWGPWDVKGEQVMTLAEADAAYEAAAYPADGQLPRSLQNRFDYGTLWAIPKEDPDPTGELIDTVERSHNDTDLLLDIHGVKHSRHDRNPGDPDDDDALLYDAPAEAKEQELLRDANPEREFWRHHRTVWPHEETPQPRRRPLPVLGETAPPPVNPLVMLVLSDAFAQTARRASLIARWVTRHIARGP
jgi:hypothetical protein